MWASWNLLPAGWTYVMRVMLVFLTLSLSACTAPNYSLPNPPAHSGDGDGGNGM